jgi:hypothetical protein
VVTVTINRRNKKRRGGTPTKKSTPLPQTAHLGDVTALFPFIRKGAEAQMIVEDLVLWESFGKDFGGF